MTKMRKALCVLFAFGWVYTAAYPQESKNAAPDQSFREALDQAEKALKGSKYADAAPLWKRVTDANPTQAGYWLNLAKSYYGLKEYQRAILAYAKALELRADYPANSMYAIACCHAMLGEQAATLEWLEKALKGGYRDLRKAQTDSRFESLREHPKYRDLVALADTSKM
ncbi:MAG: tetratricopeptide repeat protein, partial [Planctomycetes bacterium]|nr:tetratricopeptide repeat protein [Planctomycetota bacterium]